MPNRILREGILSSELVASLKWEEEVFYRRLFSIVDDYGRHEASPVLLRSRCYPLQTDFVRVADITRWMAACQKAGLILDYAANGRRYIQIVKFGQQTRTPSKCPPPPPDANICAQLPANDSLVGGVVVGVSEGAGADGGEPPPPARARKKTGPRLMATVIPPPMDALLAYGIRIMLPPEECQRFFDHFESNGWKVSGKTPMRNWQSAMNNWHKNYRAGSFKSSSRSEPLPSEVPDFTDVHTPEEIQQICGEGAE